MMSFDEYHNDKKISEEKDKKGTSIFVLRLHKIDSIFHGMIMGTGTTIDAIDWQMKKTYMWYVENCK